MAPSSPPLLVTVPTEELAAAVRLSLESRGQAGDAMGSESVVELVVWDFVSPPPASRIDMAVPPYMSAPSLLRAVDGIDVGLVQSQSIGFDGVVEVLDPSVPFANASSVHEASTAELALGLILASLRGIDGFALAQQEPRWSHHRGEALADKTVAIVGYGGVGQAIADRLAPFEIRCRRIARRARQDHHGPIYDFAELNAMLGTIDIIVLAVPLTPDTRGLIDATFLARMKPGALLVNVARGPVIDTDALLDALRAGHIRAALDVTDPEPLPSTHPLWSAPGLIISPHVGGHSSAMIPRMAALIGRQIARLSQGLSPINIVLPTPRPPQSPAS